MLLLYQVFMTEASFNIFFWLIILLGVSFILDNLWRRIFSEKKYRIFLTTGIIIHELSHALVCRIVGAKIEKINFFSWQGGYVKYHPSRLKILTETFIGFAPILGGIGALLFFSWLLDLRLILQIVDFQQPFLQGLSTAIQGILPLIKKNWLSWQFWIFIYLTISIIICLIPSKKDIKNALGGVLVIFVLGLIFYYFGFFPQFLEIIFSVYLGNILVLGAILGFLTIIFTLPIFFLFRKKKL